MKFTSAFVQIAKMRKRIKIIQGSQGASKTFSILQRWVLLSQKSKTHQLCTTVTNSMPLLRTGAIKDLETILHKDNIPYKRTKNPYHYQIGNWTFEFLSFDGDQKGLGGRRDRLFINEGNRMSWATVRPLIARTHKEVIIDFNPSFRFWAHKEYVDTGDGEFVKLTYKDNEYLPEAEREEIERYAPWGSSPDENYWRVYGLGEIGFAEGVILKNAKKYSKLPEDVSFQKMYGVDFGVTHPMTLVEVNYSSEHKLLYWRELFYSPEAELEEMVKVLASQDNYEAGNPVICDNAGAREIMDLRKLGVSALACDKTSGLVSDYRRMLSHSLYIHENSKNLWREAESHRWQIDKHGEIIEYPKDSDNHGIDAGRYPSIIMMNLS